MAKNRTQKQIAKPQSWARFSDERLLQMHVRDLRLQIADSPVEPFIERLYDELAARQIRFRPPCYFADEWLCPDKTPIIGIPFYLAHRRLKRIEKKMMLEVEGGTDVSCMKILRHECGHALNYAYNLYKKTRWRELFGNFSQRYCTSYWAQPYSRRFVTHLEDNYAQAHPDEDFAETFAVWLTPNSQWETRYRRWPVIRKLQYIDGLMQRIGSQDPLNTAEGIPPWSAARMRSTLAVYYQRKRKSLGSEFKGFYDDSLKELFAIDPRDGSAPRASHLLRDNRRQIIDNVTRWTGHRKYDIHQLVNRLVVRCEGLKLYANGNQTDDLVAVTALVTAVASNIFRVSDKRRR